MSFLELEARIKLQEARYFLDILKSIKKKDTKEFSYNLSAFLTAWRSVLDIMLYDYAEKYSLGFTRENKINDTQFEAVARALDRKEALRFIKWWRQQRDIMGKDPLWRKRIINVHRGYPKTKQLYSIYLGETIASGSIEYSTRAPIESYSNSTPWPGEIKKTSYPSQIPTSDRIVESWFEDIPDRPILTICEEAFEKIRQIIKEAERKF